jgi:soluble lytic murein transglycosylase-like protein
MINRHQVLDSALGEHTQEAPLVETKKTFPGIAPKLKYDQLVEDAARTYGLDSALLYAVISMESGYNPKAVSKKGASGLMQLMPVIAKHYGVVDLLDPVQSLHGGAKYLRDMLILFNNDVSLAVAAYNAGETAVVRYGNRIPPYRETMNYVPRVLNAYRECRENPPRPSDVLAVTG